MLVHGWLGGDVFCGLVVGVEEIVVVRVAIKLEHLSYEFCCCVAFAQGDVLPAAVEGMMMRSV